jgi:TolB-like protein/AraC-like DNA-binding protein/Tfp pilus assembly protein PilF
MSNPDSIQNHFLGQLTSIVEKNISNEQFGVSELADEMNMSRSNLLRKVKKETNLSVSQLISQVRLQRAMEMLRQSSHNVSEVSHQVGFSSTSYFIKCFREYYGYPPGEVGKREVTEKIPEVTEMVPPNIVRPIGNGIVDKRKRNFAILILVGLIVTVTIGLFAYFRSPFSKSSTLEKSIAVLPFKNDSNDSTNVYLINGLMESTLNNLQKIKDLKVISRTSSEKYRNTTRSIPEMAKELNVNYFVEGSGQKIGDRILLNIQLIEAATDKHLWGRQYRRESKDIFALQQEIATNIAQEIEAIITPEEEKRIEKNPTDDLVAYDLFLKGKDMDNRGGRKNMEMAISYFKKAIEQDREFALAYAETAKVYYYLDIFQVDKKYTAEINSYADKALLFDSKLANSLVAKALFYMHKKEYDLAIPYLEKALEYNPNSVLVINFLSDVYNNYIPNTGRYLEYALKGVKLDIGAHDSISESYNYLHLSNALIQTGFVDEALLNINKSLAYNPENPYSGYVKVYILFARSKDIKQTKELLIKEMNKDTTRVDVMQEVAKVCYMMRDYKSAYQYYKKFIALRESQQLDIFKHEDLKIAIALSKLGMKEKAEEYARSYKQYADQDRSIYKNIHLAGFYSYQGNTDKAIEHLKLFSKEDNFQYWILLLAHDPVADPIKDHPEFKKVMQDIEKKFWDNHKNIRVRLEEQGLI